MIESPSSHLWGWISLLTIVALVIMVFWAFYYWWKKDRNTRERFAFFGFSALAVLISGFISALLIGPSLIGDILFALGITSQPESPPLDTRDTLLVTILLAFLVYAYLNIFKNWKGNKSIAQYEQEENSETASVFKDIFLLINSKTRQETKEKLKTYKKRKDSGDSALKNPRTLAWSHRANKLWVLQHRSYLFEEEYDTSRKIWIGEEKNTGALVLLSCHHEKLYIQDKEKLIAYARKVANRQNNQDIEIIVALKDNLPIQNEERGSDYSLSYTNEEILLRDIVNFTDYFTDIRHRVNREKLTDSELTLKKTYAPSFYQLEEKGEIQKETLENYINKWLQKNTSKQLAVLGEYGQGKSTGSLLLSYNLIEQAKTTPDTRIPILIELRGKSLRTLSPEQLLAMWAYHYNIDVNALLLLHMAGRLLLIFEGFDEIDLSGDTEARISHFRTLWKFNYKKAKIIITGRPNFFLDGSELHRALGKSEETQSLYLAPFDYKQIKHSLRHIDENTRDEILKLTKADKKFLEVVSRPSLLYLVAVIWREQLSEHKNINSALVIDLFIRYSIKRQQEKQQDEHEFMVLNRAERHYFMAGIAAYMAEKQLPNQITNEQLQEAVRQLIEIIPEAVSTSVSTVDNQSAKPLRSNTRLDWKARRSEVMHKIQTDVRSSGLLVTDLSKNGTFKFAHKSYMELLQAQVINTYFSSESNKHLQSIVNAWKIKIDKILHSNEALGFLSEFFKIELGFVDVCQS